jgi:RNA polymerase sigma factor (sigma-70 family)
VTRITKPSKPVRNPRRAASSPVKPVVPAGPTGRKRPQHAGADARGAWPKSPSAQPATPLPPRREELLAPGRSDLDLARDANRLPWDGGGGEAFWAVWLRYEAKLWQRVRGSAAIFCPRHVPLAAFQLALLERVQETLRRRVHQYRGDVPFSAFLTRVIWNAAIDQYRYYRARPEKATGLDARDEDDTPSGPTQQHRRPRPPDPERAVAAKETRATLLEALRILNRQGGTAIHWAGALRRHYFEEKPGPQIAVEMGCSLDLVHKYLERGREALLVILRDRFGVRALEDLKL